jgi:transcriptional regulator with XRE-family HTH domain
VPRAVPPPLSLALATLRIARGLTQQELGEAAGVASQVISDYEKGIRRTLKRETLDELAAAMAYAPADVILTLLLLGGLSPAGRLRRLSPVEPSAAEHRRARRIAARVGLTEASRLYSDLLALARVRRVERARRKARRQWEALRRCTPRKRRELVEISPELHQWALAELLCGESVRAAADDAGTALELARLALRVAELVPEDGPWHSALRGFAWAFVGNAQRVASDLLAAAASFATAWRLWAAGPTGGGPLGEWRLHDLEASLRRDQRQFAAALGCLDRALAAAPAAARGRILLKKAYTLEQSDQVEPALAALEQAAPLIDPAAEPRLRWVLDINRVLVLAHLGRYRDAEARLPALGELTLELGNRLDLQRFLWVSGRIAAGLGRGERARALFGQSRREFAECGDSYDAALVSLELAILDLEEGRGAEVAALAGEMLRIFSAQRVDREALAAVALFSQAARAGTATAETARRLLSSLERARRDPALGQEDAG